MSLLMAIIGINNPAAFRRILLRHTILWIRTPKQERIVCMRLDEAVVSPIFFHRRDEKETGGEGTEEELSRLDFNSGYTLHFNSNISECSDYSNG